jgi:hypothetical protein
MSMEREGKASVGYGVLLNEKEERRSTSRRRDRSKLDWIRRNLMSLCMSTLAERVGVTAKSTFVLYNCSFRISIGRPAILTDVSRGFPRPPPVKHLDTTAITRQPFPIHQPYIRSMLYSPSIFCSMVLCSILATFSDF